MSRPSLDDAPEGFCKECHQPTLAVLADVGLGGMREWVWGSPCCGAEVVNYDPEEDPDEDEG